MSPPLCKRLASGAAIFVAAWLAAGCERDSNQAEWWQGEQERIELSHQLELKKFRLEQAGGHDAGTLERPRQTAGQITLALKSLRQKRLSLGAQVESLQGQLSGFKESALRSQRQRAIGKTFEEFSLASGRKFQAVSVSAIDDSGVTIRHADGSARLRFADLDPGQRVFFGLEEDLALAAQEKETKDAANYERWIDKRMASIEGKDESTAEIARREELATQRRRALLAEQQLAFKARPLGQAANSFASRSWSRPVDSSFRTSRPTYRYIYYQNTPDYHSTCRPVVPVRRIDPSNQGAGRRRSFSDTTIPPTP